MRAERDLQVPVNCRQLKIQIVQPRKTMKKFRQLPSSTVKGHALVMHAPQQELALAALNETLATGHIPKKNLIALKRP
jgi:hypothetical protein